MITLLATIFVFGLVVFVHELGHFIAAKRTGMRVDEFAIGFGPVIYQQRDGETLYSLRLIPLGGFNKIYGMSKDEAEGESVSPASVLEGKNNLGDNNVELGRAFYEKTVPVRMLVIAAGSIMNFLLPILLFFIVLISSGYDRPIDQAVIGKVFDNTPAAASGLVSGDKITKINGHDINSWKELIDTLKYKFDTPLSLTIETKGASKEVSLVPNYDAKQNRSLLGISQATEKVKPGVFEAMQMSVTNTFKIAKGMVEGLSNIVRGKVEADVAGPIGVAQMAGDVAKTGIMNLLTFAAFLSINLGIINLIPIPVLDGGHLVDLAIEGVRGKPLSGKYRYAAQMFGIAVLLGLMIFATASDIGKILG